MRVGMAVPAFLPATGYGGPVWNIVRLIHSLVPERVATTVLTSTMSDIGTAELPPGPATIDGFDLERMPVRLALKWSPWVSWNSPQAKIDVLHVFGAWNGLSYSSIRWANRNGVPWIWEPSGMLPARGRKQTLKRIITRYHLKLARTAAGIVWTAPQEREEAPAGFADVRYWLRPNPSPEAGEVTYPERSAARRDLGLPVEGPVWGYLGRIAGRKGIEDLLRIWKAAEAPGHLCVVGPIEDEALAQSLRDAGDSVTLLPPVTPDRRYAFLRAIDALVLIPSFGENFALVVVEAIAAGTPALVSRAVGAGYWLADHGAVVMDPHEAELARIFKSGRPPEVRCSVPDVLTPAEVGKAQARIYAEAINSNSPSR